VNETLFPMSVVLEARGFRVDEQGTLSDEPLGTYTVYYEARAKQLPAWFMILSAMTGARTSEGLNVRLELPHVVYLLQRDPLNKSAVAIRGFTFDSTSKKAVVELENSSASLGRVIGSELSASGHHATPFGGFPLFPMSRRRVEVPWDGSEAPDRVMLRFANFSMESRRAGENQ
jgi:hypothetical protein